MKFRRVISIAVAALLAVGLVSVLTGCGGSSEKKPPVDTKMQQLITNALIKARALRPKAVLYEVQGVPKDETGRAFADVNKWVFWFNPDPDGEEEVTVSVECIDGVFSEATLKEGGVNGDVVIKDLEPMGFDEAVARVFEAGYDTHFNAVAYRQPMDLIHDEVMYIFHIPSARAFVFVGSRTGKVTKESDHANLANDIIANLSVYCRRTYSKSELFTLKGDVAWYDDNPAVAEWVAEFNNPEKTPATTLVMHYQTGGTLVPPTEEQRTISGEKLMEPNLQLDPGEAIAKLLAAGYTDQFTVIAIENPTAGTEPRYVFTFTNPARIVYVGANTGVVTMGQGGVGIN